MRTIISLLLLVCFIAGSGSGTPVLGAGHKMLTKEALKSELGKKGGITIVDVRAQAAWGSSGKKIVGAIREDPDSISTWMHKYPKESRVIFYCS